MPPQTETLPPSGADITNWYVDGQTGVKSRGALIRMHPEGFTKGQAIRPYPWNMLNDNACIAFSVVFLGIFGPLMAGVIGSALAAMVVCQAIYRLIPGVFHALYKVMMGGAKWLADRIMRDPRNYPYIPWSFFMAVWAPAILYYAWLRQYVDCLELLMVASLSARAVFVCMLFSVFSYVLA